MFLPATFIPWRISAENRYISSCPLTGRVFRSNVVVVAGPSNNMPAADCQNRYPSPSKRPDRFAIGPLTVRSARIGQGRDRQGLAKITTVAKKPFASRQLKRACCGITKFEKRLRTCTRKHGLLRWLRSLRLRLAAIPFSNKVSWGPAQVLLPRPSLAVTRPPVQRSAARPTCFIVRTTPANADRVVSSGAPAPTLVLNGHGGFPAVAVFILNSGPGRPPAFS